MNWAVTEKEGGDGEEGLGAADEDAEDAWLTFHLEWTRRE